MMIADRTSVATIKTRPVDAVAQVKSAKPALPEHDIGDFITRGRSCGERAAGERGRDRGGGERAGGTAAMGLDD